MPRAITLFTGQWADLPLEDVARKASEMGYHGLELACWGGHFDVDQALADDSYCAARRDLLERYDLQVFAISAHGVGQSVLDRIDERHKNVLPDHVWGDGKPEGVNSRAAGELKRIAQAAQKLGVGTVNGFCGSTIWHLAYAYPRASQQVIDEGYEQFAERFIPILDMFEECGVQFALEPHPSSIAFDILTAERALASVNHRAELCFNFDPGHFAWQGLEPSEFVRAFPDRILHTHLKDAAVRISGRTSILSSFLRPGDPGRGWDFRSLGRGVIDFEEIIRALNQVGYAGPLSVECEDPQMDREASAEESLAFLQNLDFAAKGMAVEAKRDGRPPNAARV